MKEKKLLDKHISLSNYATFKECKILKDGKALEFIFACGESYVVQIEYFLKWFKHPHFIKKENNLVPWNESDQYLAGKTEKILRCENVLNGGVVRVFLNNNAVFDVAWDTVLMSCEERYEHFGGLTAESQRIVREWFKEKGQFWDVD